MSYWLGEYKLVVRDEHDPDYRSPLEPHCRPSERYMAVIAADGNWGVVDRRNGHLLMDGAGGPQRFVYRNDVMDEVARLNSPAGGPVPGGGSGPQPQGSGAR